MVLQQFLASVLPQSSLKAAKHSLNKNIHACTSYGFPSKSSGGGTLGLTGVAIPFKLLIYITRPLHEFTYFQPNPQIYSFITAGLQNLKDLVILLIPLQPNISADT